FHSTHATVQGLDAVAPADRPPVNVVRYAFQTMVGIGTLLALLSIVYLVMHIRRKRLPESTWFYRALTAAAPLPVVAVVAGGLTPALGRLPRHADLGRRDRRGRDPRRLRDPGGRLPRAGRRRRVGAPPPLPDRVGLMHLYDLPLIFALIGLTLYTVLAGADF